MKINKIMFENFKNKNGAVELSGLDLFTGPNGVGKSAILQGLQLALTGELAAGSAARNILKYSSTDKMSVGIETDTALSIVRKYTQKSSGCSSSVKTNFSEETSKKALDEVIATTFGQLPIAFNFEAFANMSENEQKAWLLSFCSSRYSLDEAKKYLLVGSEDTEYTSIVENMISNVSDGTIDEQIGEMLIISKEQLSFTKKEIARLESSIQKVTAEKIALGIDSKGIKIEEKKLEKLQNKLLEQEKELAVLEKTHTMYTRKQELTEKLSHIDVESLRKTIDECNKTLGDCQNNIVFLQNKDNELTEILDKFITENNNINKEISNIMSQGSALKAEYNTIRNLVLQVKSVSSQGKCCLNQELSCSADFSVWIREQTGIANAKYAGMQILATKLQEKKDMIEKNQKQYQDALNNKDLIKTQFTQLNEQMMAIQKQANEAALLLTQREMIVKELSSVGEISDVSIEDKKSEIASLQSEINSLKTSIAAKTNSKNLTDTIKNLNIELENTEKAKGYYDTLAKLLGPKGLQQEVFKYSIKPLENKINSLLHMFNEGLVFFINSSENSFVYGANNVPFDALSSGQQLLVSLAMIIAIIDSSNCNCKILEIDKADSLDDDNFNAVMVGLTEIYNKNILDNILVTCCKEHSKYGSFNVTKL